MANGQADAGPESLEMDDLAQFLEQDNPTGPGNEAEGNHNGDGSDEDNPGAEKGPAEDEPDGESEEGKARTSLKFKVPIKAEDGSDTQVEVDEKELIAGYQRHADYTRKTMELGEKEREITQVVAQKLDEGRNYFLQQAQLARAAVAQIAGLKSPQEMAALAHSDPAAWVQEQQRQAAVQGVMAQLEQGIQSHQQQAQVQSQQQMAQMASRAWGVLGSEGLDKAKLQQLYNDVVAKYAKYGVTAQRVPATMDPALVLIMRDAVAYQKLKDKKGAVTAGAKPAPVLPSRQNVPQSQRVQKELNTRFRTGKAKLGDLARYLENT